MEKKSNIQRRVITRYIAFTAVLVVAIASLTSCVSSKKIIYLQGSDDTFQVPQEILQQYDLRFKPADRVSVTLSCADPELLVPFGQNVVLGSTTVGKGGSMSYNSGNQDAYVGYTVDNEGYIKLPVIGRIKASGLTEESLAAEIQNKIIETGYIKDPSVIVKFINARVSVLGAVNKPGQYQLSSQRTTILDVLAQAGDVSDLGLRDNVKLFREVGGKREMYMLNLTTDSIFNSPAFYLQQNDVVYVQPNKAQQVKSSPFLTFWGAASSITALISSITAIVIAVAK